MIMSQICFVVDDNGSFTPYVESSDDEEIFDRC
jgi:hypothetical protein